MMGTGGRIGEQEGLDAVVVRPRGLAVFSSRERKITALFALCSLIVHLAIALGLSYFESKGALNQAQQLPPQAVQTKVLTLDQLESLVSNSRSVVESSRSNDSVSSPDKKVYLGERTQRVAKQTRAAQFGNLQGSSSAASSNLTRDHLNLSRLGVGTWVLPSVVDSQEKLEKKFKEATAGKVSRGSHDLLDQDLAVGAETLLNTDEYKYAGLFNRIKAEVAPRWEPRISAQLMDTKLGVRSGFYRTETTFVVDAAGSVIDVIVNKSSGVSGFDAAARSTLLSLPTIRNLPKDLAEKDGLYRIQLGFVVNVTQSQLQAEYVPDPRLLKKRESSD